MRETINIYYLHSNGPSNLSDPVSRHCYDGFPLVHWEPPRFPGNSRPSWCSAGLCGNDLARRWGSGSGPKADVKTTRNNERNCCAERLSWYNNDKKELLVSLVKSHSLYNYSNPGLDRISNWTIPNRHGSTIERWWYSIYSRMFIR